jgi:hypothetical protein
MKRDTNVSLLLIAQISRVIDSVDNTIRILEKCEQVTDGITRVLHSGSEIWNERLKSYGSSFELAKAAADMLDAQIHDLLAYLQMNESDPLFYDLSTAYDRLIELRKKFAILVSKISIERTHSQTNLATE